MALSHGSVGWSAVCICVISRSYSLTNCAPVLCFIYLLCYERGVMLSLSDIRNADFIEASNSSCKKLIHCNKEMRISPSINEKITISKLKSSRYHEAMSLFIAKSQSKKKASKSNGFPLFI